MKKTGQIVLREKNGNVLRTVTWQSTQAKASVIFRKDTLRLDIVADTTPLKEDGIEFDLIAESTPAGLKRSPLLINNRLELAYVDQILNTDRNVKAPKENEERFPLIMRWSGISHAAVVILVLILGLVVKPFFEEEDTTVTIVKQSEIQRPKTAPKTVSVSQRKIDRKRKVSRKKIRKVKKAKKYAKKTRRSNSRRKTGQVRTKVNVSKTGALGVLAGIKSGSKKSSGLNLKSLNNSRGSGISGKGGRGGNLRALPGKGLIATGVGAGGKAVGSGGYGTRGKGGGRAGYGKMSMVGSSGAFFQPLQEEALVQGGLDRDQIDAVIRKNMGQIVYCYEKGLQVNPSAAGRVHVKFIINPKGRVATAKLASSSVGSKKIDSCILRKLSGWKFPKPHGNVNVKVSYPFNLRRVGQG